MKALEILAELFDPKKSLPLKWTDLTTATSRLPDGRNVRIHFRPADPKNPDWTNQPWAIEFSVGDDFEMTGGGEVSTIFATVIAAVAHFAKSFHNIQGVYFTAEEQSRAKMYDTLAKRVSKQLGWHVVPYEEMVKDPKYQTPLSYGDFLFAIEPGHAPEHRQDAQKPQHSEFLPIYYVHSIETPELFAIKIKAKNGNDAESWVMRNVPEYKNEDPFGVIARKSIPQGREVIDKGEVPPPKPKPPERVLSPLEQKLKDKLGA